LPHDCNAGEIPPKFASNARGAEKHYTSTSSKTCLLEFIAEVVRIPPAAMKEAPGGMINVAPVHVVGRLC